MEYQKNCLVVLESIRNLMIKGKNSEALTLYLRSVKDFSEEPDLRNVGGDILMKLHKKDEAIIEFERCVDLYRGKELYANAIAICKKILRIDRENSHIYEILGDVYMDAGFVGEAILNYLEDAERKRKEENRQELDIAFQKISWKVGVDNRILRQTLTGFPELEEHFISFIDARQSIEEMREMDLIETIKRDPEYRSFEKLVQMELFRSKRYSRPFSVFSIEMKFIESDESTVSLEKLFGILKNNLRVIDYLFLNTDGFFYGLLPETPSDGVYILSDRIVTRMKELCEDKTKVSMRWATYPKDGHDLDQLLNSLKESGQVYIQ
jgi:lipopolysaccharide biosynthesis regulator YciM